MRESRIRRMPYTTVVEEQVASSVMVMPDGDSDQEVDDDDGHEDDEYDEEQTLGNEEGHIGAECGVHLVRVYTPHHH